MARSYTVYMLKCADGTVYTGYTFDMERRLAAHNAGLAAKYTRCRLPVGLLWSADLPTARLARAAEVYIKQLSRAQKLRLAAGGVSLEAACPKLVALMQAQMEAQMEAQEEQGDDTDADTAE